MATYILLMTLNREGREKVLLDPDFLLNVEKSLHVPGVQTLGLYAVLGQYDFVTIVEADDNDAMARFSIEFGVRAEVHITTLPAVPAIRLERGSGLRAEIEAGLEPTAGLEPGPG